MTEYSKAKKLRIRPRWLVLAILFLAFLLRVWGANFGLGFRVFNLDEAIYVPYLKQTFPFPRTETLSELPERGSYDYPSLFYYLYSMVFWLACTISKALTGAIPFGYAVDHWLLLWGRVTTALLSTLGVYLVIKIGERLFDKKVGLWAGLFAAITLIDVQMAHYVKHDVLVQLLGLLVVWDLLSWTDTNKFRYLILATASFLLAAQVKHLGLFLALPLAASLWTNLRQSLREKKDTQGLSVASIFLAVGFLVIFISRRGATPFDWVGLQDLFRRYGRLLFGPFPEGTHIAHSNLDGKPNYFWWPLYLATSGLFWPQALATLGGLVLFLRRKASGKHLILALIVPYYLVLSCQQFRADRWVILITPYLAIFAALFWIELSDSVQRVIRYAGVARMLLVVIGSLLFGFSLFRSAAFSYLVAQSDTRQEAAAWFRKNYATDQPLFAIGAANVIGEALRDEGYFNVINLFPLYGPEIFYYPGDLLIICSGTYRSVANYQNIGINAEIWKNYQSIASEGELVQEFSRPLFRDFVFSPSFLENSATINSYHQPIVQIWRIPRVSGVTPEILPDFTSFPRYTQSNLELSDERPEGIRCASGREHGWIEGPRKILRRGDYRLEYSLEIKSCDRTDRKIILRAEDFDGSRELAREVFTCAQVKSRNQAHLSLLLEETSPVKFVLELEPGIVAQVGSSLLREIGEPL